MIKYSSENNRGTNVPLQRYASIAVANGREAKREGNNLALNRSQQKEEVALFLFFKFALLATFKIILIVCVCQQLIL